MKRLTLFSLATFTLFASSALAERYGSQTIVMIEGSYYFDGTSVTTTLPNGDTRDTSTHLVKPVNNLAILEAMRVRALIPKTTGYALVMVGKAHMADGVQFFAINGTTSTVPVPSDLLDLAVQDGPINGVLVLAPNSSLKSLSQKTHNLADLTLNGFTGSGALTQIWTSSIVVNGSVKEGIELVAATGDFSGPVTLQTKSGIGLVSLTLRNSKTVDLTRFGMATTSIPTTSSGGALTLGGSGTLTQTSAGTLTINGGTTNTSTTSSSSGTVTTGSSDYTTGGVSAMVSANRFSLYRDQSADLAELAAIRDLMFTTTINTTTGGTATGLVIDANGNVTQFPTFSELPRKLVIITSSGTHTFTHDTNGVWTPSTP